LWRHNQAGDLNPDLLVSGQIARIKLEQLVAANKGKRGFTYTHYNPTIGNNSESIKNANDKGFTVNMSGNDVNHADSLKALNIGPVVVIMPRDAEKVSTTPAGNKVIICPAENTDKVNCLKCGLCQDAKRDYIIGFRAHGTAAKTVELIARG
jgi:hypothetical protein